MKVVYVKQTYVKRKRVHEVITEGESSDLMPLPGLDDGVTLSAHKPDQIYNVVDRVFALGPKGYPLMCTIILRERRE